MRLVVFGAGGQVGRRVVEYALEAGHEVRAVVRDPDGLSRGATDSLHVVVGDVLQPFVAEGAVRGADAVVSAIGSRESDRPVTLRTEATRAILAGMAVHGVFRLVLIGSAGLLPAADGTLRGETRLPPGLTHVFADHRGAWELVAASGLDWTLVCPPFLRDGPRTRRYRRAIDALPGGGTRISPADVADFVVEALAAGDYRQARVRLAD